MDIQVLERKYNPLLERDEIKFEVSHEGESTPTVMDVRKVLRSKLNSKNELTIVDGIYSHFGSPLSSGFAKVYKNKALLDKVEAKHILRKNFGSKEADEKAEESKEVSEPEEAQSEEAPKTEKT